MRESRRRLLRILGVLGGVAVLLIAAVLTITFIELPSLREMSRAVVAARPSRIEMAPGTRATLRRPGATPAATGRAPAAAPAGSPAPNLVLGYLTDRFITGGSRDIRVCENLAEVQDPVPTNPAAFTQALQRHAQGLTIENPLMESALGPIGQFMTVPTVANLMTTIEAARATGDPAALDDPGFRSQLTLATSDFFANRAAFERTAQHAYHLFVISRVAQMNPQIANDDAVTALCGRIEAMVEQGPNPSEAQANSQANMDAEKAAILRFLAGAGLTPAQVGYDPNLRNEIRAEFTVDRIVFQVPWMMRVFGTSLDLRIPRPPAATQAPATGS